ncbi:MAG: hypothetical protein A3E31_01045 [Candidatus Rokubacteria bacterium RIFCSPHIGHO2_12_FULL_73_22]|nr:MAG: hypothetical protein A3E31_01045 [Candidatus Rokubacteria bacterium RIFCSPHIGHO2_12_FULL_73_22]
MQCILPSDMASVQKSLRIPEDIVWEVIATRRSLDGDEARLRQAYPWLTEAQVRAALPAR